MTLEQHQWLHPRTANADFAAQQAQSGREARRAAVIEQFPVGSKAITSVASINRTEDVTGTVAGHKRGSVLLKTESHGVLAVEPNKLRFHGGGTS